MLQRVAYNGHKRKHAMKCQGVTSPCGLDLHLSGPLEGRRHEWTMYVQSGLDETLEDTLFIDRVRYVIYGDSGYSDRIFMEVPLQGSNLSAARRAFNVAMARSRINVEWYFKEVKSHWTSMDFKRKLRVREAAVGSLYIVAVLLTNVRNCVYPNSISQYFNCLPPSLEEYLEHKH